MDDRFKSLMDRCIEDAIELRVDHNSKGDVEIGQGFIEDVTMQLFQMRCQKHMMRWQMQKQAEMAGGPPSTDYGIGTQ